MASLQFTDNTSADIKAEIITNKGTITLKLFPKVAAKTVENFVTHAKNGYYDNVIFHRVINNFMIQSGDPDGTGMGGNSIWGSAFADEFSAELFHYRGAISMANSGPNTNGSQFFIVQNPNMTITKEKFDDAGYPANVSDKYIEVGGTPHLDGKHSVFGQVIAGMDVVDIIAKVNVNQNDRPLEDITIEKIVIN